MHFMKVLCSICNEVPVFRDLTSIFNTGYIRQGKYSPDQYTGFVFVISSILCGQYEAKIYLF